MSKEAYISKRLTLLLFFLSLFLGPLALGQESLDLMDPEDRKMLDETGSGQTVHDDLDLSKVEEIDDLRALKADMKGEEAQKEALEKVEEQPPTSPSEAMADNSSPEKGKNSDKDLVPEIPEESAETVNAQKEMTGDEKRVRPDIQEDVIFDTGEEAERLLEVTKHLEKRMSSEEWNEISQGLNVNRYEIQKGDYLWRIAERLFGSGFYYSKIWSMNPQITNPHEVEPGMVLTFNTGTVEKMPSVQLGEFQQTGEDSDGKPDGAVTKLKSADYKVDLSKYGEGIESDWLKKRQDLIDQGVYFQFASEETYEDLEYIGGRTLEDEYQKYQPPPDEINIETPSPDKYDTSGFDKSSVIEFNYKEGFFLTSFVTSNVVQDFGKISAIQDEKIFIQKFDTVYVDLDEGVKPKPGDKFSIYSPEGKVSHAISDREGFRYTIVAQVKLVKKINDVWEAFVTDLTGLVERGDRITVYTPKIDQIYRNFAKRNIEAAIVGAYENSTVGISLGDVVYLDRGRLDGVEVGNIFELYAFEDRGTGKRITADPTYKTGEVVVLTLTDNFSTALVTQSENTISQGTLALSKTAEDAAKDAQKDGQQAFADAKEAEGEALEELDIELELDDMSEDLLEKADQMQMTDDEFDELERQEREKSIIQDYERDLKELERIENEVSEVESSLNEARVDEDKFLEQQDLDAIEKDVSDPSEDAFESLDEIEEEVGRKYMDEDLNAKENPYGLTEFDLEEIDMLLNSENVEE